MSTPPPPHSPHPRRHTSAHTHAHREATGDPHAHRVSNDVVLFPRSNTRDTRLVAQGGHAQRHPHGVCTHRARSGCGDTWGDTHMCVCAPRQPLFPSTRVVYTEESAPQTDTSTYTAGSLAGFGGSRGKGPLGFFVVVGDVFSLLWRHKHARRLHACMFTTNTRARLGVVPSFSLGSPHRARGAARGRAMRCGWRSDACAKGERRGESVCSAHLRTRPLPNLPFPITHNTRFHTQARHTQHVERGEDGLVCDIVRYATGSFVVGRVLWCRWVRGSFPPPEREGRHPHHTHTHIISHRKMDTLTCELGDTLRQRGGQCPRFRRWRFDLGEYGWRFSEQEPQTRAQGQHTEKERENESKKESALVASNQSRPASLSLALSSLTLTSFACFPSHARRTHVLATHT